ncbi:phage portal protein, partial [bacterium]|nr:phage portal protein [bacterium]
MRRMKLFGFFKRKQASALPYTMSLEVFQEAPQKSNKEYLDSYGRVATVYAAVRKIAEAISAATWRLYQTEPEWQEIEAHPALKLFNNPNQFMTRSELFHLTAQHLELVGESMWLLVKEKNGLIIGILPVNPTRFTLKLKNNIPNHWEYMTTDSTIELPLEDIVHFKYPNPINPYRGLSPLRAVAQTVDSDYYASEWNKNFFYNAATPRLAFISPQPLPEKERKRLRMMIDKFYSGIKNAHKAIILTGGLEVKPIQITQKDMEFLNLKKFNREEIAMVFGVPLTKLGINENANRAIAYIQDYTFAKDTITPKLVLLREALNKYYLSNWNEPLYFDFDSIVPKDEEWEIKKYVMLVQNDILTINEVREELGYEPVDWGDDPLSWIKLSKEADVKKDADKETKLKFWDRIVEKRTEDEIFFKGWVARRFEKQRQKVLENLKQTLKKKSIEKMTQYEAELLAEMIIAFLLEQDELDLWSAMYTEKIGRVMEEASNMVADEYGLGLRFDLHNTEAMEILEKRSQRFAKQVNETTW